MSLRPLSAGCREGQILLEKCRHFLRGRGHVLQAILCGLPQKLVLVSANPEMKSSNIHISKDGGRSVRLCGKVLLRQRIGLPEYLRDGED